MDKRFCLLAVPALLAGAPAMPTLPAVLEGVVRTAGGKPAAGCRVVINSTDGNDEDVWGAMTLARTDAQGRFRCSLKPGTYAVTANRKDLGAGFLPAFEVKSGPAAQKVALNLDLPAIVVRGTLKAPGGLGAPRIAFSRISKQDGDVFRADVKDGAYSLALPAGDYIITVKAEGLSDEARRVTVKAGAGRFDLTFRPGPSPAGVEAQAWLRANLTPLATCEAGHGFADLQPLKAMVGDAHVVSLGEATHGTREFFQLKHRMLEFLVEEMSFTVFGIEASMPEGYKVNDYILEGRGDPAKALAGLYFWTWNTTEVLDMIRWMRAYNENPAHLRKVKFYGFDMQQPKVAVVRVADYLEKVDPAEAQVVRTQLVPFATDPARPWPVPEAKLAPWSEQARNVLAHFDASRQVFVEKTSREAFDIARQDARILTQWAAMGTGSIQGSLARDIAMAENVRWILDHEGPGAKAVLWAHNAHVQSGKDLSGMDWMGRHLRQALGHDMVVFGFGFNQGAFQARNSGLKEMTLMSHEVKPHPRATFNLACAAAGVPRFAVDLRKVPAEGPAARWFRAPQATREIGSLYDAAKESTFLTTWSVPDAFDAYFFVETTTRAVPNPKMD